MDGAAGGAVRRAARANRNVALPATRAAGAAPDPHWCTSVLPGMHGCAAAAARTRRPVSRASSSRVSSIEMKRKLKENTVRQVILTADMKHLGKKGEIVAVKKAYYRNYLSPYNFAAEATPELLAKAEEERAAREAEELARLASCKEQAATIDAVCAGGAITVMRKAGPDGKLFGSVTAIEVAELVADRSGVKIDKKMVELPTISSAGSFVATIKLHPKVETTVTVVVVGQE